MHNSKINILKGICILSVIILHLDFTAKQRLNFFFGYHLDMAVPVFMIISGYLYSFSAERCNISTISDWFKINNFLRKVKRLSIPFLFIFILQILYSILFMHVAWSVYNPIKLVTDFVSGGYGPGSYYFPVMLQLLLIFPLMLIPFKKHPRITIVVIILLNLIYELLQNQINIRPWLYRLLFFRYITHVLMGMSFYKYKDKIPPHVIAILFFIGCQYVLCTQYLGHPSKLFTQWTETALPTAFYALPLVYMYMYNFDFKETWLLKKVAMIGKASWHIFLVQMFYYWANFSHSHSLYKSFLLSILFNIPVGIIFYYFEQKISKKLFMLK